MMSMLVLADLCHAGVSFRAREHYDQHHIKIDEDDYRYVGFSNTINLWYEVPYSYSLGLAIGPLLGMAMREKAPENDRFGPTIRLFHAGIEYKFFPSGWFTGFFTRIGVGASYLTSRGLYDDLRGNNVYLGLGWEIPFQHLGVAIEFAVRKSWLEEGLEIDSMTPSMGFHFYPK
ncbi:MAG: hypothetical protein ACOH5I_07490 [Oligoflexus sp.]